jgi:hypothetical protein
MNGVVVSEHAMVSVTPVRRVATTILSHPAYSRTKDIKHPASFDPLMIGMASYAKNLLGYKEIEKCLANSIPSWPGPVLKPHHSPYTISFAVAKSIAPSASDACEVVNLLYGRAPINPSPTVVILGVHLRRVQAVQILRHLLWMRYSLDIIDPLSVVNTFRAWLDKPYDYLGRTMPVRLQDYFHSAHLAVEDRIAIRHISIYANLETLLEQTVVVGRNMATLWPDNEFWTQTFPRMVIGPFLKEFRASRNEFSHDYATPRTSLGMYGTLFGEEVQY